MKKIISIFILLLTFNNYAQNNTQVVYQLEDGQIKSLYSTIVNENLLFVKSQNWLGGEKVSDYQNEDSRDMGIAIGMDSTIHIVYVDDVPGYPNISRQRITYKNKTINGDWSAPLIIDEFNGVAARNNHEASIAVSNNGDVHVVYHYWAYDGTGRNQIGYSKYTNATQIWSTELISGTVGTVYATYSNYPRLTTTSNNVPVVVWGNDNRNNPNYDEAFLSFPINGIWQSPIEISSSDSTKAQFPRAVSIGGDNIFILFQEKNADEDTTALYYRIFDAGTAGLTPIKKIELSERPTTYQYYNYDVTKLNDDSLFIALNVKDTIISFTYDFTNDILSQNSQNLVTDLTAGYLNYNLLSICSDTAQTVHIASSVWNLSQNSPSFYYTSFDYVNGFSVQQNFSTEHGIDEPQIVYGVDNFLHIVYSDDSEDTNNDGYVDREVYYTSNKPSSVGLISTKKDVSKITVYPNPSASGKFRLDIDTKELFEITVFDSAGRFILETKSNHIDLMDFQNGIYFLYIKYSSGVQSVKIVKG